MSMKTILTCSVSAAVILACGEAATKMMTHEADSVAAARA